MSYTYLVLTKEQVRLLDHFSPALDKVKLSELLDNALSLVAGEIPAGSIDATKLASNAVTTIKILNDAVTTAKILNANVTKAKLETALQPSHVVKYGAIYTTLGGNVLEAISVPGVLATDIVQVTLHTEGAVPVTVVKASTGADLVNVTFSADPSNDHVINYTVLRAA